MKKRYLKTVEEVIALKDTDTKIYDSCYNETDTYNKFVNGVLCRFDKNGGIKFNDGIYLKAHDYYFYEEEQEQQEATEKDIGKLCWVSDDDCGNRDAECFIAILSEVCDYGRRFRDESGSRWEHCFPLTKEEIKEFMEKAE